jgi:LysM repeat protein
MNSSTARKSGLAAAAASALIAVGVPLAMAAPTAVPPFDGEGYVNSTARCSKPETAVVFGTTETSRVAICETAAGDFEYRGVRVRDGARLIVAATQSGDTFSAESEGVTYTVTTEALSVSVGGDTFRTESWTDFHSPQAPASSSGSSSSTTTSGSAKSSTSSSATTSGTATSSGTSSASPSATSSAPKTSAAAPNSAVPLPPPMPAEAGASTGN